MAAEYRVRVRVSDRGHGHRVETMPVLAIFTNGDLDWELSRVEASVVADIVGNGFRSVLARSEAGFRRRVPFEAVVGFVAVAR